MSRKKSTEENKNNSNIRLLEAYKRNINDLFEKIAFDFKFRTKFNPYVAIYEKLKNAKKSNVNVEFTVEEKNLIKEKLKGIDFKNHDYLNGDAFKESLKDAIKETDNSIDAILTNHKETIEKNLQNIFENYEKLPDTITPENIEIFTRLHAEIKGSLELIGISRMADKETFEITIPSLIPGENPFTYEVKKDKNDKKGESNAHLAIMLNFICNTLDDIKENIDLKLEQVPKSRTLPNSPSSG